MKKIIVITGIVLVLAAGFGIWLHKNAVKLVAKSNVEKASTAKEPEHVAYHGGCLNAMVACENGHAEIRLEGGKLKCWFVGGGQDTNRSVRIPDKKIVLQIKTTSVEIRNLTLEARPIELAEEKVGNCSYFEGQAPWLAGLTKFTATAMVNFKGKQTPMRVEYPGGYDPD